MAEKSSESGVTPENEKGSILVQILPLLTSRGPSPLERIAIRWQRKKNALRVKGG